MIYNNNDFMVYISYVQGMLVHCFKIIDSEDYLQLNVC